MRITLTLEEDIAAALKRLAHRRRAPFKQVVNEILRQGLSLSGKPPRPQPFRVEASPCGFQPGIDPDRLNR